MLFKVRVMRQGLTEEGYLGRYLNGGRDHVGIGKRAFLAEGTVGAKALGKECRW